LKLFLNIIFPPRCVACQKTLPPQNSNNLICESCFAGIEINNCFYCPKCGRRLYETKSSCHREEKFVLAAASHHENQAVRALIHALKYKRLKTAAEPLALILKLYLRKIGNNFSLDSENFSLIPMPLHSKKEKKRGFNQTHLILQTLDNKRKIEKNVLFRIKNTESQTRLENREKRMGNVKDSFEIRRKEKIAGKNIILFDDVFTSGATMREAARVLKEAGAKKIIGLVITKA
ncbi:MAG: double zinc ribbon domain-containing protein, partial [Patescibacteria group bacterium]